MHSPRGKGGVCSADGGGVGGISACLLPPQTSIVLDELPVPLVGEVFTPLPMAHGKPKREESAYKRESVASMFKVFDLLAGKRCLFVRLRRTACD